MRLLARPKLKAADVAQACAKSIKDPSLSARLKDAAEHIRVAEKDYLRRGPKARLYKTATATAVGGLISTKEMARVYDRTFVRKGSPVRAAFYDKLVTSAPNGVCPFCYHRTVATLDHYLPKSEHPALAVTPVNLVPSCTDCNKVKLAKQASTAGEQLLHPYFDDVDDEIWLYADVIEEDPPSLVFRVDPPAAWPKVMRHRIAEHFRVLELNSLFISQAGRLIGDLGHRLNKLREQGGEQTVSGYLTEEAVTRRERANNSWQAAAYDAMSASKFFCAYVHSRG